MMSIASRNLFTCPNPQINTIINASRTPQFRNPNFPLFTPPIRLLNPSVFKTLEPHFTIFRKTTSRCDNSDWRIRVKPFDLDGTMTFGERGGDGSSNSEFYLDGFLSFIEFLCLASSVAISIILALNSGVTGQQKLIFPWFGEKGFLWQCAFLVVGVFVGTVIRRRQWRRICKADFLPRPVNFVERIEKVEAELKSSATMIQVLSRQLEKLGIRFRVFRKALKEPIAETAALAQKNSEATRALAMQEDILEKELVEIQKVLLAMQDQQQKQLELILAIAKFGKLWDNQEERNRGDNTAVVDGVPQSNAKPFQGLAGQKEPQS